MQNLEQIRARNALRTARDQGSKFSGQQEGEVVKKIPPMILNHGLLATAAYSMDEKQGGWKAAFDAIAQHLSDPAIDLLPRQCDSLEKMLEHLTGPESSSGQLRLVTAESMAWLNYARRFITKNGHQ